MKGADRKLIRLYLLGRLGRETERLFEVRYFEDDLLFESLLKEEDCLISDYVAEKLSRKEREAFEQHFLKSPERLLKVQREKETKTCSNSARKEPRAQLPRAFRRGAGLLMRCGTILLKRLRPKNGL